MTSHPLSDMTSLQLCFYGSGSMAEAIVRGIISDKLVDPSQISMLNRQNHHRLNELHKRYGVLTILQGSSKEKYISEADIVFLAMKPKDAAEAITELRPLLKPGQLLVSVIAGLSMQSIELLLGVKQPLVRAMPNTSSTIGLGATGISYSETVSQQQRDVTEAIFASIGMHTIVEESLQSAVTGVSGSGPAYVYYFMEAMIAAAEQLGLTRDAATKLVIQTVQGAAEMVLQTGEEPAVLRHKVTSPNGTTEAALHVMSEHDFSEIVMKAVHRSAERAVELGTAIERSIQA